MTPSTHRFLTASSACFANDRVARQAREEEALQQVPVHHRQHWAAIGLSPGDQVHLALARFGTETEPARQHRHVTRQFLSRLFARP